MDSDTSTNSLDCVDNSRNTILYKMYVSNVGNRLREMDTPSDVDCQRWPWELMQNAKDSISGSDRDKIDVILTIEDDFVIFQHDGCPFNGKTYLALLYKYSEGKSNNTELLYRVFSLKGEHDGKSTIKFLNSDGTAEIIIFFLPIELETYECNVIFVKENVGEFQYTIEGRVEKPQARKTEIIEESCIIDELKDFYIDINLDNLYLKKALDIIKPLKSAFINGKQVTTKLLTQKFLPSNDKMTFFYHLSSFASAAASFPDP